MNFEDIKPVLDGLLIASGNLAVVTGMDTAVEFLAVPGEADAETGKHFCQQRPAGRRFWLDRPLSHWTNFRHAYDQAGHNAELRIASDGLSFSIYPLKEKRRPLFVAPLPRYERGVK